MVGPKRSLQVQFKEMYAGFQSRNRENNTISRKASNASMVTTVALTLAAMPPAVGPSGRAVR